ncbi:MAG: bleomycin resistance family protein [Candidatus Latescibacteria bacterium]|nr:bleomycin resistance family protein [Candidatus Latescibacterota bacterium]
MRDEIKHVENTIPVLGVADLARSIRFYTEVLDFQCDWGGGEGSTLGSVSKDGHSIMLLEGIKGELGSWVWIGMEDDALFDVYTGRGVTVVQEPQNHAWAYEMKIADIDDNVLWLGTGTRKDLPLHEQE